MSTRLAGEVGPLPAPTCLVSFFDEMTTFGGASNFRFRAENSENFGITRQNFFDFVFVTNELQEKRG